MTTVPNGFSREELEQMLDAARTEEETTESTKLDASEITEILVGALEGVSNFVPDKSQLPVVHKMLMFMLISHVINWHTKIGVEDIQEGDEKSAVSWLRDAGKLQSLGTILEDVSFGPEDFTFHGE